MRTGFAVGERLAARTLELIDIPSESRGEIALARHVQGVLSEAGVPVRDAGDCCVVAGPEDAPIVLAGHLDTVPAQGNLPGRIEGGAVHGLGASDMQGALAVMIELLLAGARCRAVFFPREELPAVESALTPLLERDASLRSAEFAVVMEPTNGIVHAGCVGNINATWRFHGVSGHSARPWEADNAIHRAATGIAHLAAQPHERREFAGLEFVEAASVTRIGGGIAMNVIPDLVECHVNFRYAPGRSAEEAEERLAQLTGGFGELTIDANAPSGEVWVEHPAARKLISVGGLEVAPKQAWTPVAEFTLAGVPAINFGPGHTAQAHRRDEHVRIDALEHAYDVLERFLAAV